MKQVWMPNLKFKSWMDSNLVYYVFNTQQDMHQINDEFWRINDELGQKNEEMQL